MLAYKYEIEKRACWRSAIAFGKFEEITKSDERADVLNKLFKIFPMLTPVESAITIDGIGQSVIVFQIDSVNGRLGRIAPRTGLNTE